MPPHLVFRRAAVRAPHPLPHPARTPPLPPPSIPAPYPPPPRCRRRRRPASPPPAPRSFGASWALPFVFPAAFVALWKAYGRTPLGNFGSPQTSFIPWRALEQLAALGGLDAVNFAVAYAGALAALLVWEAAGWAQAQGQGPGRRRRPLPRAVAAHAKASAALAAAALAFYAFRPPASAADGPAPRTFRVTCVARVSDPGAKSWSKADLWDATRRAVAAGDDIVAWTEEGVAVRSLRAEEELLRNASELAASGRSYLVITYHLDTRSRGGRGQAQQEQGGELEGIGGGVGTGGAPRRAGLGVADDAGGGADAGAVVNNVLALFRPGPLPDGPPPPAEQGEGSRRPPNLAFRYIKTHPVPFVEEGVQGGPGECRPSASRRSPLRSPPRDMSRRLALRVKGSSAA